MAAARIGEVLYWLGCAVAMLIVVFDFFVWLKQGYANDGLTLFVFIVIAFIIWIIGRACRDLLAGGRV